MNFLPLAALAASLTCALPAQNANVTVLHGIPGLPKPVEVFANDSRLFSFDFGEQRGPLSLPPGTYDLQVKLDGNTVLRAPASVAAGRSYSAIAHLKVSTGITLSIYENDISALDAGQARVSVRHTADAPAVDVRLTRGWWPVTTIRNLANPGQAVAELPARDYRASLFAAGTWTRAFGPVDLPLPSQFATIVYAVGSLSGESFTLLVQTIDLRPELSARILGVACAGTIGVSTNRPEFGKPFQVTLRGGPAGGHAVLNFGLSDRRILFLPLPLDLDLLGAPGCSLYTSIEGIQLVRTDRMGNGSYTVTLPSDWAPEFRGLYLQYWFAAPRQNRLGAGFTDYVAISQ